MNPRTITKIVKIANVAAARLKSNKSSSIDGSAFMTSASGDAKRFVYVHFSVEVMKV